MRGLLSWLGALLLLFVFVPLLPAVAWAQEGAALPGFLASINLGAVAFWIGISLGLVEVLKRVCSKIPGKTDDEIMGWIEFVLRKVADFLAGKTGDPSDPSLVRKE